MWNTYFHNSDGDNASFTESDSDSAIAPFLPKEERRRPPSHVFRISSHDSGKRDPTEPGSAPDCSDRSVGSVPDCSDRSVDDREEDEETEAREQIEFLDRFLGVSFARTKSFWLESLPNSILLGAIVGLATWMFFGTYLSFFFLVFSNNGVRSKEGMLQIGSVEYFSGEWWWLLITVFGNVLAAFVFLHPKAPEARNVPSMFQQAAELTGHKDKAPFAIISSWASLCSGAALGPEMPISTLGCAIASLIQAEERSRKAIVSCGLAAAISCFFKSPLLGALAMHELGVVARPSGNAVSSNADSGHATHDHLEQITLTGASSIAAFMTFRALCPDTQPFHIEVDEKWEMWHMAAAIPLGIFCGILGTLFLFLIGTFRVVKKRLCRRLRRLHAPHWIDALIFPTLAGLVYGIIAVAFPLTIGTGIEILRDLLDFGFHKSDEDGIWNGEELISPATLFASGMLKLFCAAMCLGTGFIGGQILPLIFSGACIGLALPFYITALPKALTVPCCMFGIVGSFIPVPLTFIVATALYAGDQPETCASVFATVMVSFATSGGLGIVQSCLKRRYHRENAGIEERCNEGDEEKSAPVLTPCNAEIVNQLNSVIFGGA